MLFYLVRISPRTWYKYTDNNVTTQGFCKIVWRNGDLWLRLTYCVKGKKILTYNRLRSCKRTFKSAGQYPNPLHLPSGTPININLMTQETPTSFLLPTKTSFLLPTKTSFLLPTKTRYRFENIKPTLKNLAIV